jgi:hypothetical protein
MAKKSPKPRDLSQMARAIVEQSVSEEPEPDPDEGKDPAAVARGRAGGAKGGKARAEALTADERSAIARKAAQSRWENAHDASGAGSA